MLKFCLTCQKDRPYSTETWRTVFTKSGKKHYHMCPHCVKSRTEAAVLKRQLKEAHGQDRDYSAA
jgi:hypothetical protein